MPDRHEVLKDSFYYTACPALLSGATQAILFNPFDRALYVRVKCRRAHFVDVRNFEHPFQGFMNAAVYRTLVGASYMFWQDTTRIIVETQLPEFLHRSQSPRVNAFLIGATAGCLNGVVLNGMQVVKYRMWNMEGNQSFMQAAMEAYRECGVRIFFRGIGATALRDCVFGIVYESFRMATAFNDALDRIASLSWGQSLCTTEEPQSSFPLSVEESVKYGGGQHVLSSENERSKRSFFFSNLVAALIASVASSPLNYVRSVIYAAPSGSVPMRYLPLLKSFYFQAFFIYRYGESFTDANSAMGPDKKASKTAIASQHTGLHQRLDSVVWQLRGRLVVRDVRRGRHPMAAWRWVNSRLNIGWGSVRVGLGMAIGQSLFHMLQDVVHRI